MSKKSVDQVISRAVSDAAFRRQLQRDPAGALAGFDLTKDERTAITSGDPARLTSLGIDQRMSKAFIIGGMGEASKVIVGDASASSTGVLVDEGTVTGRGALIDDGGSSGHGALIDDGGASFSGAMLDPDTAGGTGVIVGDPAAPAISAFEPGAGMAADGTSVDAGSASGAGASVTAFEPPAADGTATLDAGAPTGGNDAALDGSDLGTAESLDDASGGLDTGGDVRPTEY